MALNHVPITPLALLRRNARVFASHEAVVHGSRRWSYGQFHERVCRLANGLAALGIGRESKVAVLAPNVPMVLEAHFGIPLAGGAIVAMNTRLAGAEIAYILQHSQSEALLVDREWLPLLEPIWGDVPPLERVVVYDDPTVPAVPGNAAWQPEGAEDYEAFLAAASAEVSPFELEDEEQIIAIDYTSGTTGKPKGVMYTHRSACLNAISNAMVSGLERHSRYLWTLPMFHCNGWCYTWGAPSVGATSICLRTVEGAAIRDLIRSERVTHLCGAPIVLQFLADLPEAAELHFGQPVLAAVGGAPPSPTLIAAMRKMNIDPMHLYGLTETYGPITICEVQDEWLDLPLEAYSRKVARQGVANLMAGEVAVLGENLEPVPADGETMGEICMRGNTVMKGYYRDEEATAQAFRGGWFHSGDLGVLHPDGYIELRDRAKDIIVSGGENVSTIEVENALSAHPDVQEVAVVSRPDERWGEVPVAFVLPKPERELTEEAVIAFCRERLAHFKCPKAVIFEPLPRTSTGKVQKFVLRERLWAGQDSRIKG
ncbi:MAG: long-chain-fatty-acid--CoA ligase [SAR324 cluster bacterium]|nr:long-chain-fatty-acid--CoA ligase [SAR324 cluster bacterium]